MRFWDVLFRFVLLPGLGLSAAWMLRREIAELWRALMEEGAGWHL
jgi:hypothetical protein